MKKFWILGSVFLLAVAGLPAPVQAIGSFTASDVVITPNLVRFTMANLDRTNDGDHGGYDGVVIYSNVYCADTDSIVATAANTVGPWNVGDVVSYVPVGYDGSTHTGCVVRIYTNGGLNDYQSTTSFAIPTTPPQQTLTLNAIADTYVKDGQQDRNHGGDTFMRVRDSGNNRSLVRFDQSALDTVLSGGTVLSATLQLTLVDNGNNWGATGRTVDVHRMLRDWAEGSGTEAARGTDAGATWNCAVDTNISNQAKNCSGVTEWTMGQSQSTLAHPWAETPTDTQNIVNGQSGVVEFDVSADVISGATNAGWLIRKTNEGQTGMVSFGTKESPYAAQLVVVYQPN